jgi:putative sigma-54 modulation protein
MFRVVQFWYYYIKRNIMDVIVQSLGFRASETLENYIREKLEKIRPNENIIRANVALFQGPDRATKSDYCEIRLEVPGPDVFVKEHAADFEQAVDTCVHKLEKMLRKAKEKQTDRWHGRMNDDGPGENIINQEEVIDDEEL